jgi:multimeric flavodoxin WrbA
MKILLISASPRKEKSSTLKLAREVLRGAADKTARIEIIHLADLRIYPCRACERCHRKILDCRLGDDVGDLTGKFLAADGIILASPNYINQVAGPMKMLFDRLSHFIHCKRLLGKYICGVVCSGSGYDQPVLDYIKYYANICGAQYSGGVSSRAPAPEDKLKEAFALGRRLAGDINKLTAYPRQEKLIRAGIKYFARIVSLRKDDWKQEYCYWKQKGWLQEYKK